MAVVDRLGPLKPHTTPQSDGRAWMLIFRVGSAWLEVIGEMEVICMYK